MGVKPDLTHESALWTAYPLIAGLDEAGRGALAGPVCVGAVILPTNSAPLLQTLNGVRDSKQLTPRKRSALAPLIRESALTSAVGFSSAAEIDSIGIVAAIRLAAVRALQALTFAPDYLLTDFRLDLPEAELSQTALVKGDQLSLTIACASILAKTVRDETMQNLSAEYPAYGLAKHKGYGTSFHREKIIASGFSPIHRKTFQIKK
ncbi:MAG: ribonuclease HII [Anaerolineales bacterium]|nr:ribonuclease HII [Anaerolineales bacterium]